MKCPFCNGEMQHGTLSGDGRSGVRFDQKGTKLTWSDRLAGIGALKVKKHWFYYRFNIEADYCENCKKIILDAEVGK